MKMGLGNIIATAICFVVWSPSALADEQAVSLDAHVHGTSELTIAMEGESLEIQFTSPAMNLLGFEHKANSREDIAAVKNAEQLLKHKPLFLFSDDQCEHLNTSIDVTGLIEGDDHDHEQEHHTHSTERKDEKNEHDANSHNEQHSDVVVNYRYRCKNTSKLSAITVNLFESFPGIQKIHVMWVKQTQQGAITLTANNRIIKLR